MKDSDWFGAVALIAAVLVVLVGGWALSAQGSGSAPATSATTTSVSYLNLTIAINATTGMPQYLPANFSVPRGEVKVTLTDEDLVANWSTCPCQVTGTVGNTESINGSAPVSAVNPMDVAHTFSVPQLGINVYSPGQSTITFTLSLDRTGQFSWFCEDPCGADGLTGAPMGLPGYMSGTMTVF